MVGDKNSGVLPDGMSRVPTRLDRLVAIIDYCKAAKEAADELDEKFLAYLLAMAIQEARATIRRTH